ncbi:MAG TPA: hypothetical protein VIS99_09690 [Terrimicrobiaceae bacterium]
MNSRITVADIFRIKRQWNEKYSIEVGKAEVDKLSYKLKIETKLNF